MRAAAFFAGACPAGAFFAAAFFADGCPLADATTAVASAGESGPASPTAVFLAGAFFAGAFFT
ncbi:hypothetical protein ACFUEL_29380, partial [Kitasatospora sp. NPDC057198]